MKCTTPGLSNILDGYMAFGTSVHSRYVFDVIFAGKHDNRTAQIWKLNSIPIRDS